MKKTVFTVLYLMVATTVVFYWPKIISSFGNDGGATASTLAEKAHMDETAYFALREVASVQLGFVLISYEVDGEGGKCRKRFSNAACPTLQGDQKQLMADQKLQQDRLHQQILLLGPMADEDGSGYVTVDEGSHFRDLYELGHLVANCSESGDIPDLEKRMREYQSLKSRSPEEIRALFP